MGFLAAVGTVILYIFIIIAALLLIILLLSIPKIRLQLDYNGNFSVKLKYLFLNFNLLSKKEKPKQNETKTDEKADDTKKPEKKKKPTPRLFQNLKIHDYIELVKIAFTEFIFKIKIEKFDLMITVASPDAAKTAINYGKITTATAPLLSFLSAKGFIKKAHVNISTDFLTEKTVCDGSVVFYTRLLTLLYTVILAFGYLKKRESYPRDKNKKTNKNENKGGVKNG